MLADTGCQVSVSAGVERGLIEDLGVSVMGEGNIIKIDKCVE